MKNIIKLALPLLFAFSGFAKADYPEFQKGMTYVSWWHNQYSSVESNQSLQELSETNTERISLLTTQYVDSLNQTDIHSIKDKTPTDNSLVDAINNSRDFGMEVMLKPHIDVGYNSKPWRGYITFSNEDDWKDWFDEYKGFIKHYAQFAEANDVNLFCIGTELKGTTHRQEWNEVIQVVRENYHGKITYAANWDNFENISWLGSLDYIGIDAYFPLTSSTNPTVSDLVTAWQPNLDKLETLHQKFQKPILLTEIGYKSKDGTNIQPWSLDTQEQADCYQAAFESLWDKSWFSGMYWWAWDTHPDQGGLTDEDYTPHGKPAENILKVWYSKERKKSSVTDWNKYE